MYTVTYMYLHGRYYKNVPLRSNSHKNMGYWKENEGIRYQHRIP